MNATWKDENLERYKEKRRQWRLANPDKQREYKSRSRKKNPATGRAAYFRKKYGINPSGKEAIFIGQGSSCGWCASSVPRRMQGWALDHDHDSNVIRGVLCHGCNVGLEHFLLIGGFDLDDRVRAYLSPSKMAVVTILLLIDVAYGPCARWR